MRAFLVLQSLLLVGLAHAQTHILSVTVDPLSAAPSTLFTLLLAHDGVPGTIRLDGDVATEAGEQILRFATNDFAISPGEQILSSAGLSFREFAWAGTERGRAARSAHQFPTGEYTICVRVIGSGGNEAFDDLCDRFVSEEQLFIDLTEPWDRDTIDEVRPTLFWTLSGTSFTPDDLDLVLVLAPMEGFTNAQRAVGSAVPTFNLRHPAYPLTPFPSGVPSLERGRCYAWQVQLERNGTIRDRSEAWSFCVRPETVVPQHRYVLLGNAKSTSIYAALDERIYFRFNEPYNVDSIACEVFDVKQERTLPEAHRVERAERPSQPNARALGTNLYEFDLAPYRLRPGTYELRVSDAKGRDHSLIFSIDAH